MKKIIIIIVLLLFNFCIVYAKITKKEVDKIDIRLDEDELGIIYLKLDNSTSLLLKYKNRFYLYLIDYIDDKNIKHNYKLFTNNLEYIYMNNNYNIKSNNLKIVNNEVIDDLIITDDRIKFNDKNICINKTDNCNIAFITKDDILVNDSVDIILYNNNLNDIYIDYINSFWIDTYPLSTSNFTIVIIGKEYSVNNLIK